jgi:Flp pilus assembly protein TadG
MMTSVNEASADCVRSCAQGCGGKWRAFADDERGATAIVFALMMLPILSIILSAIDYGRATYTQSQLQTAADAAVIASARRLLEGEAPAREAFDASFRSNLPENLKNQKYGLKLKRTKTSVSVAAHIEGKVPTTMLMLVGLQNFNVTAGAQASLPRSPLDQPQVREQMAKPQRRAREEYDKVRELLGRKFGISLPDQRPAGSRVDREAVERQMRQLQELYSDIGRQLR